MAQVIADPVRQIPNYSSFGHHTIVPAAQLAEIWRLGAGQPESRSLLR
ncbi:hypothetical protein ACNKU7_07075 [Microbulbifer sp. SA54]